MIRDERKTILSAGQFLNRYRSFAIVIFSSFVLKFLMIEIFAVTVLVNTSTSPKTYRLRGQFLVFMVF